MMLPRSAKAFKRNLPIISRNFSRLVRPSNQGSRILEAVSAQSTILKEILDTLKTNKVAVVQEIPSASQNTQQQSSQSNQQQGGQQNQQGQTWLDVITRNRTTIFALLGLSFYAFILLSGNRNEYLERLGLPRVSTRSELKVVSLNDKIDEYQDSIEKVQRGKKATISVQKLRRLAKALLDLNGPERDRIRQLLKEYLEHIQQYDQNIIHEFKQAPNEKNTAIVNGYLEDEKNTRLKLFENIIGIYPKFVSEMQTLQLNPKECIRYLFEYLCREHRPRAYVLEFPGDVTASRVQFLRQEISSILLNAQPSRGDIVILQLNSGGGTVTGYGLSAAQLVRIKDAGLKLVVCVDEVAASGGYLMACVADTISISPFAVLGSIGVIATIPNFAERLQREGVLVDDVTAGKYKRTMTPYKKITVEDREKTSQDIHIIYDYFKQYVKKYRPHLNIEEVATGETWIGHNALAKGLCDEIKTFDEMLLHYYKAGYNLYKVNYTPIPPKPSWFGEDTPDASADTGGSRFNLMIQHWLQNVVYESLYSWIQQKLSLSSSTYPFTHSTHPFLLQGQQPSSMTDTTTDLNTFNHLLSSNHMAVSSISAHAMELNPVLSAEFQNRPLTAQLMAYDDSHKRISS